MKKYLITSPDFYTNIPDTFKTILSQCLQLYHPEYALFRDKENTKYDDLALEFVKISKQFKNLKSILHQKVDLASKLGANGVHLTSTQFGEIEYAKSLGLEVIISTHTHEEVVKAQSLGADAVTYSPIFASPNKGEPKGVADLKTLLEKSSIKVFALGGIVSKEHVAALETLKPYGFASIRYFQ